VPSRWLRRRWDEDRGDEFAAWGGSTWFFATDEAGVVEVQLEVYDGGQVLIYDASHSADQYGGLADQPIDVADMTPFVITEDEFSQQLASLKPLNRS